MGLRPGVRFEVFKRDGFTCRYCGKKSPEVILEVDHAVPLAVGGSDDDDNLVTACYECNRGKGARLLTEIPLEESFHDRAVLIAEREIQIGEYNHWKAQQRSREDREIAELRNLFCKQWNYADRYWRDSDARRFLRVLGYDEMLDVLEIVTERTNCVRSSWAESAWLFLCGICRGKIADRGK